MPRRTYQTRKPLSQVTPLYEDAGLFKTALCDLMLELIPQLRRNERGDVIIRGFVDRKTEIDIFFAGRRVAQIGPLERHLKHMMTQARTRRAEDDKTPLDVTLLRLPVRAEGAWRRSLKRDDYGWETGTYHFVVARWSFIDARGETLTFGESPEVYTPG
jgi:hypothetical protein